MTLNELIRDVVYERDKNIVYIANRTGYTLERLHDIVLLRSPATMIEARDIFDSLGVCLSDYICVY